MATPPERPDPRLPGVIDADTLTRNWNELLQELRVTQTGAQILTGFLLTLPFTGRFDTLDELQRTTYLVLLVGSVLTTGLIVAPVAFHRMLFRRHQRPWIVSAADKAARGGLVLLALVSSGVIFLVFDLVIGRVAGLIAGGGMLIVLLVLWVIVPRTAESRLPSE